MNKGQYPTVGLYLGFEGESLNPAVLTQCLRAKQIEHGSSDRSRAEVAVTGGKQFAWFVKLRSRETLDIRGMLLELQKETGIPGIAIEEVCRELKVRVLVACAISPGSKEVMPVTAFPQEFIQWAAGMGAAIAIDVKGWRSDQGRRAWIAPEEDLER